MATHNAENPERIAIVRLSHLGDVVLALPLFHALRAVYPAASIAWVVQHEFASLLEGLPGLERVVRFDRRGGARGWLALRADLASFAPDLAVDAQGNLKSGFALLASGAARRVGLARGDYRERLGAFAATEHAFRAFGEHAMERTRALCEHLVGSSALRRDPGLTQRELEHGRELWRARGGSDRTVLLQLSKSRDVRSWPLSRCIEFARGIASTATSVLVLSGPGELEEGRELERVLSGEPRIRSWVGQRGLRELAAFFSAAAEHGASYVGCDTGPTHLAAACGMNVTVLSGPQSHHRTGPWPVAEPSPFGASPHRSVRARNAPECAPCFARVCRHPNGPICMADIAVDDVRTAAEHVFSA